MSSAGVSVERPRGRILHWLMIAGLLSANALGAADPFYTGLLQKGGRDLRLGLYEQAIHKLRIACFGLLDEPELLAQCLVELAIAQGDSGDRGGFLQTFDRVAEIEERFGAYGNSQIPDDQRRAFEARTALWVPAAELSRAPTLTSIRLQTDQAQEIGSRDRPETEPVASEDPENPEQLLARALETFERKPRQARQLVERLLAAVPDSKEGLCLLGRIGERLDVCIDALAGLPSCPDLRSDVRLAAGYLECLIAGQSWQQAREFGQSLDEPVRERRRIVRLISGIPEIDEIPVEGSGSPTEKVGNPRPPATEIAIESEQPIPGALSSEDRAAIETIRDMAQAASTLADLAEPLRMATELADARSHSQEAQFLAAEIAYLGSNWTEAIRFFRRAGEPESSQPLLRFYMAVSLFEAGFADEAAEVLVEALPLLKRTALVESYAARILPEQERE